MSNNKKSIEETVETVNRLLPLHNLWDGLWVHRFKRSTLSIGAAFDRSSRRDYDIVFKKVIFFNLPSHWRDSEVEGDDLVRLASVQEFKRQQPDFDPQDLHIFAIDILLTPGVEHTFYVVAKTIFLFEPEPPDDRYGGADYKDPYLAEQFPCLLNRVSALARERSKSQP